MLVDLGFGVNSPEVAALLRAWKQRYGHLTPHGERWIVRALERVQRQETTMSRELERLRRH